ncbi:MAG: aldo/keto reductase, partial [Rhodospirillales bacterium]
RLIPEMTQRRVPVMAYSPLEQGRLAADGRLKVIAGEAGIQPLDLALAWVVSQKDVFAIPKSVSPQRIDAFVQAVMKPLHSDLFAALELAYPPPPPGAPRESL